MPFTARQLLLTTLLAISLGAGEGAIVSPPALELRAEASILGGTVHLRQIGRWASSDNGYFRDLADITVARFDPGQREITLELSAVRTILEGAGVAGGEMTFRGPVRVTVRRLDADAAYAQKPETAPAGDLNEFLEQPPLAPETRVAPATQPAASLLPDSFSDRPALPPATLGTSTLRAALGQHLAERLGLAAEDLELSFPGDSDRVLNLQEPAYSWKISTFGSPKLGAVTWRVALSNGTTTRQVQVVGTARMWQEQLRCVRPMSAGQVVRTDDVETKRVLLDRLPEESPVSADVAMKMQVVRSVAPGSTISMRLLKPVLLVQPGQLVTITSEHGGIKVQSVGRAQKEPGAYGQAIRVEVGEGRQTTMLRVTVTGPQEARAGGSDSAVAAAQ